MLATSPSQSPRTFENNGPMVHPSYQQSSAKFAATTSQRSPKVPAEKNPLNYSVPTPPQRSNYQNATTQYSPMSEPSHNAPEGLTSQKQEGALALIASKDSMPNYTTPPPRSSAPEDQHKSPGIKRRQSKDVKETGLSAAPSYTSKRPKSTKTSAKILPVRYEFCEVEDIVILIADMISELIETNDNLPLKDGALTRFHSRFVFLPNVHLYIADLIAEHHPEYQLSTISRD